MKAPLSSKEGVGSGPHRSRKGVLAVCVVSLLSACFASVALGSRFIPIQDVVHQLFGSEGSMDPSVVRILRLPRTATGLAVGASLGAAGALMQGLIRNPLGDPGVFGINAGAALGVVTAIFFLELGAQESHIWFALAGAALAGAAVYLLGATRGGFRTGARVALAGAAAAALFTSLTTSILLNDQQSLDTFRVWVLGSLAGRDLSVTAQVLPFMGVGLLVALASGRSLNLLALGDDVARSLGRRPPAMRAGMSVAVLLLAGSATAAVGPIAFLGLAAPHIARGLVGHDYRWVVPVSMLLAPAILLAADVVGRLVVAPGELQTGIMTALIGAPFLVFVARGQGPREL